ncbi:MAG: hypothetical protein KBC91_03760 [Candidatus Omnitrophica bacterium]|nr:hypothetical protein [Candidatus Omnitrophota bacterium]
MKNIRFSFGVLIVLSAHILFFTAKLQAEESAVEKDLNARQKMEWKRFYLDAEGQTEMPQTSLAVDFFNQAVEAYQGQDYELAREALVESLKLNARNAYAYELMGDMAAEEHDIEAARENYKKAYLIQPSEKLREKIEKNGREVQLDTGFHEFKTGHFILRTKQTQAGHSDKLGTELEALYSKLVKDFGYAPREALPVTLYERREFQELTQLPHWVGGVYDGNIRLPAYSSGILEGAFSAVAIHEMTHAFVGRMSRKKAPSWIQEGLAVYMENQVQPRDFMVLRLAVKTNSLLPMDQMMNEQKVTGHQDALFANLFYDQAYSLTDYLIRKYGMFKIKKLLKSFGEDKDYDSALRSALGVDPAKLEKRWKNSLIKKYS